MMCKAQRPLFKQSKLSANGDSNSPADTMYTTRPIKPKKHLIHKITPQHIKKKGSFDTLSNTISSQQQKQQKKGIKEWEPPPKKKQWLESTELQPWTKKARKVISMTTTNKNNHNRKCFSLHPENTECNKKRIMKENLYEEEEEEEEHKGHHNRNKSHPKTLPKKKVERSRIIIENKNNSRNNFSLHPKNTDCNKKAWWKKNYNKNRKAITMGTKTTPKISKKGRKSA